MGRRPLLTLSAIGMSISTFILGTYFLVIEHQWLDLSGQGWIPLVCLVAFMVSYAIGYCPLPWTMSVELFPREAQVKMSSIAVTFAWTLMYLIGKFSPGVEQQIHRSGLYFIFSASSFVGIIFTMLLVPETKGKTPEDMKLYYMGKLPQ